MRRNSPFIKGTIILTLTGLLSRIIGFFYRIYLSRLFGEEGMGVYQLLSPVLALSFSVTAAGMQTAISKYVAGEISTNKQRSSFRVLFTGLTISLGLSFACMGFIMHFSEWIAANFLLEERTASMLRIIALSIPLGAVHSCINGYFYGICKTTIPAVTQLMEQFCRIICVFAASHFAFSQNTVPTIHVAVLGLVVGELCAMIISILAIYLRIYHTIPAKETGTPSITGIAGKLLAFAVPLSATRIVLNFLQSIEAVYIPTMLQVYGYDSKTALSVYGVLTGMAMPLLFFPNALTGSVSLLLLPLISKADATGNRTAVRSAYHKTLYSCLFLGCICTLCFLLLGGFAGSFLFGSTLAGRFIRTLSFLCPFLYISTTLSSILHGLGRAGYVFVVNVSSLLLRLAFVFLCIPHFGIESYLAGMLLSHIFQTSCFLCALRKI